MRSGRSLAQLLEGVEAVSADADQRAAAGRAGLEDKPRPWRRRRSAPKPNSTAHGRVLIRASGTEPVLRVMVEARDEIQARTTAERLAEAVRGG